MTDSGLQPKGLGSPKKSPQPSHVHNCFECGQQRICNIQNCHIEEDKVAVFLCLDCEQELDNIDESDGWYDEYDEDDDDISDIDNVPEDQDF